MGGRRVAAAIAVAIAVLLVVAVARSQAAKGVDSPRLPARVRFEPPACAAAPFDVTSFVALLRIELHADGVAWAADGDAGADDPALATISIDVVPCSPATHEVRVALTAAATGKNAWRMVSLADATGALRSRLLALAVAELVRSRWAELAALAPLPPPAPPPRSAPMLVPTPPPVSSPASPPLHAVAAISPPPPPARAHVAASFEARGFLGHLAAEGGRARASIALSSSVPLRLTIDGGALFGRSFDRLGSVDVTLVSAALGLAGQAATPSALFEVGPEIELGGAWASGHAFDPAVPGADGSAFVVTSSIAGAVRSRLTEERMWIEAALRAGVVLRGVTLLAEGREAGAIAGGMLGVRVGIGLDL